jgi:GDPmannose 4,6-dehydratase
MIRYFFIISCLVFMKASAENTATVKKALIFGVTGQDGAYLAQLLLEKGYEVHGVKRRSSSLNTERVDHIYQEIDIPNRKFILHYGDLADGMNVSSLIQQIQPDEIYNLAAQSHVRVSFEIPEYTSDIDALGVLRILEAIHSLGLEKKTKFYQASSSEQYGLCPDIILNEKSPFYPRSPYAVSKLYAYWITVNYREAYGIYACNGILFNHESPLRGETFVTRKITLAACRQKLGLQDVLYLGNLDAMRDWGYAKDYVEAIWLMLQQEEAKDFVIATGESHSVREFVELAYRELGYEIEWHGSGCEEYGIDKETKRVLVKIDPRYFRPTEVPHLQGDASQAATKLQWKPRTSFQELVKIMVEADYQKASKEALLMQSK